MSARDERCEFRDGICRQHFGASSDRCLVVHGMALLEQQQRIAVETARPLLDAVESALQLAGVPERNQDDHWQAEYARLCEYEALARKGLAGQIASLASGQGPA